MGEVQVGEGVGEGGGGWGRGRGLGVGGQGTFHPPSHVLHMVLRPKGTSHNETNALTSARSVPCERWICT